MMTGATYDMLFLVSLKFEEDEWLCLGNDNENDKTDNKKQSWKMAVQLMNHFFLHHKNLKETKDGIWRMMKRTMKSMKVCKKHKKVSVAAIVM